MFKPFFPTISFSNSYNYQMQSHRKALIHVVEPLEYLQQRRNAFSWPNSTFLLSDGITVNPLYYTDTKVVENNQSINL